MLKKNFIIAFIIVSMLLVGCNNEKTSLNIDMSSVSKSLLENIAFKDELELVDSEIITMYYELPENTEYVLYMGSGATAEELAIFKLDDENKKDEMIKNIKEHIDNQIIQFEDYNNEELKKLENSLIEVKDNYVILCITDDIENAKSQINNYMK